jgi:hypothetical protein
MNATYDSREAWDRLTLLLIARPIEGWEDVYEEIIRREVERLAPHQDKCKGKGPKLLAEQPGLNRKDLRASIHQ